MKKIKSCTIMLIILFIILMQVKTRVEAINSNAINVKAEVGFDGEYKVGYLTPIKITITNNYKDINGQLQIKVPTSSIKYVNYVRKLNIQKGATKVITTNVPINISSDGTNLKYTMSIIDGNKNIYMRNIELNNISNTNTAFIGVISEDSNSLNYISDVKGPKNEFTQVKLLSFNESNFPDNSIVLKNINLIVIDDFDTSKFSKKQYSALKAWVNSGGTLIIGTGNNYEKTLSIFKDGFISGAVLSTKQLTTTSLSRVGTKGDSTRGMKLTAAEIKIINSKKLLDDNGVVLAQKVDVGEGAVGITSFSLGENPMYDWSNNYNFINWLIGKTENSPISAFLNTQTSNINSDASMAMDYFSEMGSIKLDKYYILLFLYVLILIPGGYIYLKKLDKRNYMWALVPACAIAIGVIIYISSIGTGASRITANVITTAVINKNGVVSSDSYGEIVCPRKKTLRVQSRYGDEFSYLMNTSVETNSSDQGSGSEMEGSVYPDENNAIEFDNINIFKDKIFKVYSKNVNIKSMNTALTYDNGRLEGRINNSTGLDLQDCYIITPTECYKLGDIKNGTSRKIDKNSSRKMYGSFQDFSSYVLENTSYVSRKYTNKQKVSIMDHNQEAAMTRILYNNRQVNGLIFIGLSKTPIHAPIIVNNQQIAKNERTLISMAVSLKTKNNIKQYPLGTVPYKIKSPEGTQYDSYSKFINEQGDTYITYSIDKKMKIQRLDVVTKFKIQYRDIANAAYSIYNFTQKKYENIGKGVTIKGSKIGDYVDYDNKVKIKIEPDRNNQQDIVVPQIAASGRDR